MAITTWSPRQVLRVSRISIESPELQTQLKQLNKLKMSEESEASSDPDVRSEKHNPEIDDTKTFVDLRPLETTENEAGDDTDFVYFDPMATFELKAPGGLSFSLAPVLTTAAEGDEEDTRPQVHLRDVRKRRKARPFPDGTTRRPKKKKVDESAESRPKLTLTCEWDDCEDVFDEMKAFVHHVSDHIEEIGLCYGSSSSCQQYDQGEVEESLTCLWRECDFESSSKKETIQHICFHAFHTKLKYRGKELIEETEVPPCLLGDEQKNILPNLGEPFKCHWGECERATSGEDFPDAQRFFWHVRTHAEESRGESKVHRCRWGECEMLFISVSKLKDHLRSHSQEREFACPTCGALFSNRCKLFDHCKRQTTDSDQGFPCSYCGKRFSLERLLRDHIRVHINNYKCPMCDMTCLSQSTLDKHMNYRHSDERPHACPLCDFKGKSLHDLVKHETRKHGESREKLECPVDDCKFQCVEKGTLKNHISKIHRQEGQLYLCHLCEKRFQRGYYLTRHLKSAHKLNWPSGHSRFRYKREDDGLFRLQNVRFEGVEIAGLDQS